MSLLNLTILSGIASVYFFLILCLKVKEYKQKKDKELNNTIHEIRKMTENN